MKELSRRSSNAPRATTSRSISPRTRTSHGLRPSRAIDFDEGTLLTHHVLEAMRRASVSRILYASGSGVYGDIGEIEADEDRGPLIPISTYGASKLAGEALISAYCFMFGLSGRVFRFGNVVGPWQTHGVGLDFVRSAARGPDPARDPRATARRASPTSTSTT